MFAAFIGVMIFLSVVSSYAQTDPGLRGGDATDPGPRRGAPGAGGPLPGLTAEELELFDIGLEDFEEVETISEGLGPRLNLDGCAGCHLQPAVGGSSPPVNPQVALATLNGARNVVPDFIRRNGPVREVRFQSDGQVHALFVISGRVDDDENDASGCRARQENFRRRDIIFRIPTPVFGAGLVEQISNDELQRNRQDQGGLKQFLGISGRTNQLSNGTLGRFGWKSQHSSLFDFAGEAYNVEMGITSATPGNDVEREQDPTCQFAEVPNDDGTAVVNFENFMRFLAPPQPSPTSPGGSASIQRGRELFSEVKCNLCHTPTLRSGSQEIQPFSDFLLHNMGSGLADGIRQLQAQGDEFRTAPLWGVGQRLFFLHDGRTSDLLRAILAHQSPGSEANKVIELFKRLGTREQQDILNFLRSL